MRSARKAPEDERQTKRAAGRGGVFGMLDTEETRAVLLTAVSLAFFLYFIRAILLPFILAAVIAYICTPGLDWLARRTRWPRPLFAVITFLILIGLTGALLAVAGERLVAEVKGTGADVQSSFAGVIRQALGGGSISLFGQTLNADQIAHTIFDRVRDWLGQTDQLVTLTGYSLGAIMGVFLTAVLLLYFLLGGRGVARGMLWIVPPHRRDLVRRIWQRVDPALTRYFIGVIAVVVYATVAAYIGLGVILGIDHAVMLALLTGILETVPVIGPTAAATIAGLVSLRTATGLGSILAYAAYATALRLSIDQVFGPLVLGRAARVHPVLIIFCFLSGAVLLGVPGVIIAVPVALIIKNTLATLYGDEAA